VNDKSQDRTGTAHGGPSFLVWRGRIAETCQGGGYARLRVEFDPEFPEVAPGQFFMARFAWGPALPRAFSALGAGRGWIDLFVRTDGVLREAMSDAPRGAVLEVRGPYGVPYADRIDPARRYVLVGGGSGVAPLLRFAEVHPGLVASLALGFRSGAVRELLPGIDLAVEDEGGETADDRLRAAWRDGLGVIACGPEPLLASVARRQRGNAAAYVSLETRLGCGFGACRGCSIPTPSGMRRVCVDGPLFACSEVPWLG
jgi:dihydroorotate dehydrogenase electron transfer subunit